MRINIEMFIIAIIAKKFLTNYLLSHSQNDNNKYISYTGWTTQSRIVIGEI